MTAPTRTDRDRRGVRHDLVVILGVMFAVSVAVNVVGAIITTGVVHREHHAEVVARDRDAAARRREKLASNRSTHHTNVTLLKAEYRDCRGRNGLRAQILTLVNGGVTRATESLKATLASPTATAEQKATAIRNLYAQRVQQVILRAGLADETCRPPPAE